MRRTLGNPLDFKTKADLSGRARNERSRDIVLTSDSEANPRRPSNDDDTLSLKFTGEEVGRHCGIE